MQYCNSLPKYYRNEDQFHNICLSLKIVTCPHCGTIGCLIRHGTLDGYTDKASGGRIQRGHRIFCSNRYRKNGCGRTTSILIAGHLTGFIITATTLWKLLTNTAKSVSRQSTLRQLKTCLSDHGAYRIFRRVVDAQSHIRSVLFRHRRHAPQVAASDSGNKPLEATMAHLKAVFPDCSCPITAFQNTFQTSFLG